MEPAVGRLTGQDSGPGRMPEPEEILKFALGAMPLQGKHVMVTAGGTREPIDSVRFIGNSSTGRMGIELAKAARDLGANVTLIAANVETAIPAGIDLIRVSSVDELELAMDRDCDLIVMSAAVSDFKVKKPSSEKLKRGEAITLDLLPTKDLIANYVANHSCVSIAFALADFSGEKLIEVATSKLWDKGVDFIVGNSVTALGSEDNQIEFISRDSHESASGSKAELSRWILERVIPKLS